MTDPAKILITEDEILIAREIELTLKELGYSVTGIASNGQMALEQVTATCPDLVLMDIVIPGDQDGIETAHQIRTRYQVPVLFLTAYADADTLRRAKITEPFGYVLKPFQPQELHIAIQIALVRSQAEQQRLNALRNNISTALPHEINTLLHNILGFTEILMQYHGTMPPAEMLEGLRCIRSVTKQLERVCQNVLLYAKLETIATSPDRLAQLQQQETCSTLELIQSICEQKAQDFARPADLWLELQDGVVQMAEVHFRKLVAELVDNAFRFSEPGGPVRLSSQLIDGQFSLTVRDSGRGMTEQQVGQIGAYMQFEREAFEQQGLGLGLALVQQLVRLHGGAIQINSQVDQGTTVSIQLMAFASA